MTRPETTTDAILGGRLELTQPRHGYRIAIDPVFLAAAVPAMAGERVLDVGAGVGTAGFALAIRVAGTTVVGLENQQELHRLAEANIQANGLAGPCSVHLCDILDPPTGLADMTSASFDHVMANPPFMRAGESTPPTDAMARGATVEGAAGLADWVAFGARMLKPDGTLTIIHRADRLDELHRTFDDSGFGGTVTFPLWPDAASRQADTKRVIVQGRRDSRLPPYLAPGLVLHAAGGGFTDEAEAVLRHLGRLDLGERDHDRPASDA